MNEGLLKIVLVYEIWMSALVGRERRKTCCKYAWHQLSGEPISCLYFDFMISFLLSPFFSL